MKKEFLIACMAILIMPLCAWAAPPTEAELRQMKNPVPAQQDYIQPVEQMPGIIGHIEDNAAAKPASAPPPAAKAVKPNILETSPPETPQPKAAKTLLPTMTLTPTQLVKPRAAAAPAKAKRHQAKKTAKPTHHKRAAKLPNKHKAAAKPPANAVEVKTSRAEPKHSEDFVPVVGSIIEVAQTTDKFHTLIKLLQQTGLRPMLETQGNYTIFAPDDAAFARLSAMQIAELVQPENRAQLRYILSNHIIGGQRLTETALLNSPVSPDTMAGQKLSFALSNGVFQINGAHITGKAIPCSNGIIYVVDRVLSPMPMLAVAPR